MVTFCGKNQAALRRSVETGAASFEQLKKILLGKERMEARDVRVRESKG